MTAHCELGCQELVEMYRKMVMIRRFEERFLELRDQGKARGGVAISIGQEAVAVGVCSALRRDDYITSTHRGDAHCLAKGADPGRLLAEFLGRGTGYCSGKGGAMHVAAPEIGLMGTNGIVGAGIPIAAGLALAAEQAGTDQIAVSFFGDGATNTGAFYEALNLAAAWRLPVVFVCENNLYAIATRITEVTRTSELYRRGEALGLPARRVDGNDVLSVYEETQAAVDRARRGDGPTLLECLTYRWLGWAWIDKDRGLEHYRSEDEWLAWKDRCPVEGFRAYLLKQDMLTADAAATLVEEVEEEVEEAVKFALGSAEPDPSQLWKDVFTA